MSSNCFVVVDVFDAVDVVGLVAVVVDVVLGCYRRISVLALAPDRMEYMLTFL